MLKEGDKAPGFSLDGVDADGKETTVALKDYNGRKVVLYFYPKDNTPGCTTEACDFRDNLSDLKALGVRILGISPDKIESHKRFRKKQSLNFPLLSDVDREVASSYGAFGEKKSYGKTTMGIIRSTFLIDEKGKITKAWYKVTVKDHVDEVLEAI
jgi:peroxiredoxin Q/BCP